MLYTGSEIAKKYSTETIKLTENNIRNWTKKGLKHINGPHNKFLYKEEWVETFLEEQAVQNVLTAKSTNIEIKRIKKKKKKINYDECKVY